MNECAEHWEAEKKAVQDRGMWHLVSKTGEEVAEAVIKDLEGTGTASDWDPLMSISVNLSSFALLHEPAAVLAGGCPLCIAEKGFKAQTGEDGYAQSTLDDCADAMLDYAREQGLVPTVQ